ncbi:hypothetical protein AXF42_Ash013339 [Apostasia shenzhenica]|uniref:CRIB domain-containing protein n=1 Tax=Apostasia shenzhenica TaxID=1088818 RepID=A0A2I0BBN9_9ASPA|nr:hypothetical protein AXF42_Ash013339 [Apostasia shenzhenica]
MRLRILFLTGAASRRLLPGRIGASSTGRCSLSNRRRQHGSDQDERPLQGSAIHLEYIRSAVANQSYKKIDGADSKEHVMQIGYPTDVKHVAHIGWDGPSATAPSWVCRMRKLISRFSKKIIRSITTAQSVIQRLRFNTFFSFHDQMNEFRSAPLTANFPGDPDEIPELHSSEFILTGELPCLQTAKLSEKTEKSPRRKKSSQKSSDGASAMSPKRESSGSKHSQRRNSSKTGESEEGSRRSSKRETRERERERTSDGSAKSGVPVRGEQDMPGIPKQTRQHKNKASSSSSGGGSSRSSGTGRERRVPPADEARERRRRVGQSHATYVKWQKKLLARHSLGLSSAKVNKINVNKSSATQNEKSSISYK